MSTKRSKIAISSSSINNRGRVLTSSNGSIRILKCYLKTESIKTQKNRNQIKSNPHFEKKKKTGKWERKKMGDLQSHNPWICQCFYQ